ncbi:hypothetical protein HOG98_09275 [bacterium]|nr:hypothetical protein [bacterium]
MFFKIINPHIIKIGYRFSGILLNANTTAKIAVVFIIYISFIYFYQNRTFKNRTIYIILFLGCIFILITCVSFSSFFTLGIVLLILILYIGKNHIIQLLRLKTLILLLLLILGIAFLTTNFLDVLITPQFKKRILTVKSISDMGSGGDKVNQFKLGLEIFTTNPLIGIGLENGKYNSIQSKSKNGIFMIQYHCFYILILIEGGIFTLLGFIYLFLTLTHELNKIKTPYIKLLFTFILITQCINLLTNNNIYSRFFWIPIVLIFCDSIKKENSKIIFENSEQMLFNIENEK